MTSPKLERMYDERRTRLQAAYEICPELEETVEALRLLRGIAHGEEWEIADAALAKLDKIK